MALGVLNNLSAVYAENNLNKTSSSLQKVLQQLSSGSKINSGSDDAAGLSLVNGLAANEAALTQSATNATEGVGLLQVADGALSQITTLLDRAITLATEASNGTLNSTQESAADQEYQSLLAEITNIGSTTTYNQEKVFSGNTISIYTGDSSSNGASLDNLNIRTISASSVGDTNGEMAYTSGADNVFLNLSTSTTNAQSTDSLSSSGTSSITVTYLMSGTTNTATTTITVGTGTSYDNTAQGLMNAINNSGLGLTATFGTAKEAGTAAVSASSSTETGIIISGTDVATGSAPGVFATLDLGSDSSTGTAGTLTLVGSDGTSHTIDGSSYSAATLTTYINSQSWGVTVSDDGSGSLTFSSTTSSASLSGSMTVGGTANTPTKVTYYQTGLVNSTVEDTSTSQSAISTMTTDTDGTGIATISYTDSAGVSLSGTDLTSQENAQAALLLLNEAVSDVASMDGYIGAQINTLDAISDVMTTQQQDVLSAQNAIQATDYASATSDLSKYEVLTQTGIAALAQANSIQQEVTKLLQ